VFSAKADAVEQEVTFDDGASTTLESWGQSGPAVICVHGITSSRKSWERTAAALQSSFRVFAYDQRGHGDSASVPGPMTLQRSLDDLRAIARTIGGPAALIGHSWGGAVALLGGREPFATKVVAIDPMVRVEPGSWRREYLDDTEHDLALAPSELETELRARLTAWHPKDVEGKLHAVRHMKADAIARLGSDNRVDDGGWDLHSVVAQYPRPLLILMAGADDSVMSSVDLEFIRTQGGPNVKVEAFADQGHNLHRTAFDRYIAATSTFLSK
jgi:pimeloyl-ACP methyl ester carboxylesterase